MAEESLGWAGTPPTAEIMDAGEAGKALADHVQAEAVAEVKAKEERRRLWHLGAGVGLRTYLLLLPILLLGLWEWWRYGG